MNHSESVPLPSGDADAAVPALAEADLWQRVHASMERLRGSGSRKSDPAAWAQKLADRSKVLRGRLRSQEKREPEQLFLAFEKGDQRYAVAVENALEVQALDHYSPVPGTPAFLTGVIHWRGAILALLDVGKYFGIAESGLADTHVCVIVEAAGRRIALVAREVEEIVSVPLSKIQPPPHLPNHPATDWVLGVLDEERLVLRMDAILRDAALVGWKHERR